MLSYRFVTLFAILLIAVISADDSGQQKDEEEYQTFLETFRKNKSGGLRSLDDSKTR